METNEANQNADNAQSATGEGNNQQQANSDANSGVQQRINELTAKMREAERRNEELTLALSHQTTQLMQQQQVRQAPEQAIPADPFANVDWSDANSVKAGFAQAMQRQTETLTRTMQQQFAQVNARFVGTEVQRVAAGLNAPPDVISRAEAIAQGAKVRGVEMTAQDAVDFAVGEAVRAGKWVTTPPKPRDERGQFMPVNGFPPAMQPGGNQRTQSLPADFDRRSADEQLSLLAARGVEDIPF